MKLIYIAGSGRSGSTLLDLLLGTHTDILSLGEVHRISMPPIERIKSFGNRCSCGLRLYECSYWEKLRQNMNKAIGIAPTMDWSEWSITTPSSWQPLTIADIVGKLFLLFIHTSEDLDRTIKWIPSLGHYQKMAINSWNFYEYVAKLTNVRFVVDSTKTASRLKCLYIQKPHDTRVIHLVRDGRGVAFSLSRHYKIDIRKATQLWLRYDKAVTRILKTIPNEQIILIRYEDLCVDTDTVLNNIFSFINVSIPSGKITLPSNLTHMIPGHLMSSRGDKEVQLDERWRSDLSSKEINLFEKIGGSHNILYGYEKL